MAAHRTAMTKNRVITPRDWISDYFSPLVTVLSSQDAEAVVGKNNLSPVELLQPFSKLLSDLTLKDPEGNNHAVHNLNVTFQVSPVQPVLPSPFGVQSFSSNLQSFIYPN